jgi:hypothetical protein
MGFLPLVVAATYEQDFRIRLTFNDGVEASVDFSPWLTGEVFDRLKSRTYFQKFFLDGGTVVWPNGADVAPETLYEAATRSNHALQPTAGGSARRRG